jgi:transposase-like protein
MAGRKLRDEEDAVACLEAAEDSGLGDAAWARQHGIDGRSLHAWRLNLERRGGERSPSASPLRVVELVSSVSSSSSTTSGPRSLRVRCGPFVIEVEPHFDAEVLARLLDVVAAC